MAREPQTGEICRDSGEKDETEKPPVPATVEQVTCRKQKKVAVSGLVQYTAMIRNKNDKKEKSETNAVKNHCK